MRRKLLSVLLGLGLLFTASAASGQAPKNYDDAGDPTNLTKMTLQRPYKAWGLIGLLFVLCVVVTFKSSKRSHLD